MTTTITGDVCYYSTTLTLHQNFVKCGSFKGTTITFKVYADDKQPPVTLNIADLINLYDRKNPEVSNKIRRDLRGLNKRFSRETVKTFSYEDLWLHMPKDPCGLKGIIAKNTAKTAGSVFFNGFCGYPIDDTTMIGLDY